MAASDFNDGSTVLVTWTRVGKGEVLVVATCKRCSLLQERLVKDSPEVGALAILVGTEALAHAGCSHTELMSTRRRD